MSAIKFSLLNFIMAFFVLSSAGCSGLLGEKDSANSDDSEAKEEVEVKEEPVTTEPEKEPEPVEEPVEEIIYEKLSPKDEIVSFSTASSIDQDDIRSCLFNLGSSDFDFNSATLDFRRVEFEKVTGTLAIALEDLETTDEPQIVLIRSLETIGSDLIYKLMNPNAYYCFKNLDSVGTDLKIHLHCEAKLSETLKWTDDNWKTASQTMEDAFVYLSKNKLTGLVHESPEGANCIENRK